MLQRTIKKPVSCKGVGLHSGLSSVLTLYPGSNNSGIVFKKGKDHIAAFVDNLAATNRGTSLKGILTVEHVLSAINGMGITNIEIHIDGEEPPALDGSSEGFVELIKSSGIENQAPHSNILELNKDLIINSDGSSIEAYPCDRLYIESLIEYPNSIIGTQSATFDELSDSYEKEIAPARTFGFMSEVEALKRSGLARGASLDNAVAVMDNGYSSPLRFPNELARHKILDIIGDIALAGKKINAKIISRKAGHKLNIELVRRILDAAG